jgi:hypothetical protein
MICPDFQRMMEQILQGNHELYLIIKFLYWFNALSILPHIFILPKLLNDILSDILSHNIKKL